MALARRLGADRRQHITACVHSYVCRIEGRQSIHAPLVVVVGARAGVLDEAADAYADLLPPGACLCLLLSQLLVIRHLQQLRQCVRVVAAVVQPSCRRVERLVLRLDEVLHPYVHWVQPQPVGHHVHHPFDDKYALHRANAPVGSPGALVGQHAIGIANEVVDAVRANDGLPGSHRL